MGKVESISNLAIIGILAFAGLKLYESTKGFKFEWPALPGFPGFEWPALPGLPVIPPIESTAARTAAERGQSMPAYQAWQDPYIALRELAGIPVETPLPSLIGLPAYIEQQSYLEELKRKIHEGL